MPEKTTVSPECSCHSHSDFESTMWEFCPDCGKSLHRRQVATLAVEMLAMLKELMWYHDPEDGTICISCHGPWAQRVAGPPAENHAKDCELVALIKRAGEKS